MQNFLICILGGIKMTRVGFALRQAQDFTSLQTRKLLLQVLTKTLAICEGFVILANAGIQYFSSPLAGEGRVRGIKKARTVSHTKVIKRVLKHTGEKRIPPPKFFIACLLQAG